MTTIICDSSSLIDIGKTSLILEALGMPYCYVIPDVVAEELQRLPGSEPRDLYQN